MGRTGRAGRADHTGPFPPHRPVPERETAPVARTGVRATGAAEGLAPTSGQHDYLSLPPLSLSPPPAPMES